MATHEIAPFVVGAAASAVAAGPLASVFSELGLVLAIMGTAGGVTRGLALRGTPWREVIRSGLLGGLLAFGFGVIGPDVLEALTSIEIAPDTPAIAVLAATAFGIGFMQERIFRLIKEEPKGERD